MPCASGFSALVELPELHFELFLLACALTSFGIALASRMERMESFQMVMALVL